MSKSPRSVSVAICAHNGAKRLPQTLKHLRAQQVPKEIKWEVLLIDNASTDDTAEVARRCWHDDSPPRLKIVREPQLGLSNARIRAFSEAQYEIVAFVDDDNWVAPDWVETASHLMCDPAIGAINGVVEPVCETEPPPWFLKFKASYAMRSGDELEQARGGVAVWGAGLVVRKPAWDSLREHGFKFACTDRYGSRLSGGGDLELVLALSAAGWKMGLDKRLRMKHFVPRERLTWPYLRRIVRECSASTVLLDAYRYMDQDPRSSFKNRIRQKWWYHFSTRALKLVRKYGFRCLLLKWLDEEGSEQTLAIESAVGGLRGYVQLRGRYEAFRRQVRETPWSTFKLPENATRLRTPEGVDLVRTDSRFDESEPDGRPRP